MKKQTSLFLGFILLLLTACQNTPKEKKWMLVWEDNFNQSGTFDEQVWSKIPRGGADWDKYMSDFDSCYQVKDGNLILSGIRNHSLPDDTARFLTGGVYTKGKKEFSNGKIEIRAKLGSATGAWPAFWLLSDSKVYGGYPKSGEIDIMEHLSHDSIVYQTIHSHYTLNHGIKDRPVSSTQAPIRRDDYNVYSVALYPDSVVFAVNDRQTLCYPRIQTDKDGQYPFDQPFYLLLDMQLGGSWVGAVNAEELPVRMEIDWVKFYELK